MTSEAQLQANRANAAHSTGPRTAEGNRRVALNARRHGLSGPPPRDDVLEQYAMITGRRIGRGQLPQTDVERAAYDLAEAEVWLARATRAEEQFLASIKTDETWDSQARQIERITMKFMSSKRGVPAKRGSMPHKVITKFKLLNRPRTAEHRRLARYRKAAEVRRHKTIRAWISLLRESQDFETKPSATSD